MTKKFNLINYNVFVRLFLALTFSSLLSRLSNDKRGMERSKEEEEKLTLSQLLLRSPLTTRRRKRRRITVSEEGKRDTVIIPAHNAQKTSLHFPPSSWMMMKHSQKMWNIIQPKFPEEKERGKTKRGNFNKDAMDTLTGIISDTERTYWGTPL